MNQRNIFTVFSILLIIWSAFFFFVSEAVITGAHGNVSEEALRVGSTIAELSSAFIFIIGLLLFATRNVPHVLSYFTIGATVLVCVTFKHFLIDHVNVPIAALIFQPLIAIITGFLWYKDKFPSNKTKVSLA